MEHEVKTYSSFSGTDILIILDNKIIGETYSINIDSKKKELIISAIIFQGIIDIHEEMTKKENSKLLLIFGNEYDFHMYRIIEGIKYSHEFVKYSIDDKSIIQNYVFNFENANPYKEHLSSIKDLRNQVFN